MADFIGPIEEKSSKRSLDDIVASVVGKREDRPDVSGIAGMRQQMAAPRSRGVDKYESSSVETIAKGMVYTFAHAFDKEEENKALSVMDGVLNFNLKNNTTNLEKDATKKFNLYFKGF